MRHHIAALTSFTSLVILLVEQAGAQGFENAPMSRAGNWETSVGLLINDDTSSNGPEGSSLDIEKEAGLAFSIGYNMTKNFAVRFDAAWQRPDYEAVINSEAEGLVEISHELTVIRGHFNGVWNMLDGGFTPYAQAGVGWTYIDSNVSDGPPTTGCWWDPWWGYICSNFYSTYSDTNFSWTLGLGLRYELGHAMFLRGGWERTYLDADNGADPEFDALRAEIGWKF